MTGNLHQQIVDDATEIISGAAATRRRIDHDLHGPDFNPSEYQICESYSSAGSQRRWKDFPTGGGHPDLPAQDAGIYRSSAAHSGHWSRALLPVPPPCRSMEMPVFIQQPPGIRLVSHTVALTIGRNPTQANPSFH
jgi:hypothetical protein